MPDGPIFTAPDFGSNPIEYLQQVRVELNRVEWPSRDHVIKATMVVLIVSILVGSLLSGLDFVYTHLFGVLLR